MKIRTDPPHGLDILLNYETRVLSRVTGSEALAILSSDACPVSVRYKEQKDLCQFSSPIADVVSFNDDLFTHLSSQQRM